MYSASVRFSFRAIRPSLPLGGELCRETKLPLLLHLHRVSLLPDGIHLWLRDHTSGTEYVVYAAVYMCLMAEEQTGSY